MNVSQKSYLNRDATQHFAVVTDDELLLVSGGGILSWLKKAANWVKDHVYVDTKNRAGGIKGKF